MKGSLVCVLMNVSFFIMTNAESDVSHSTCRCIERARWALAPKGLTFAWEIASGYGQNKSKCVTLSNFLLETEIPYLISIDRDIVFPPDYLEKLYNDLLEGYDHIAGLYCLRSGKGLSGTHGYGRTQYHLDGKIQEFQYIPWGFTGISRKLLQKMVDDLSLPQLGTMTKYYPFCEQKVSEDKTSIMGDDTSFCEKARKVGVKSYVDTSIQVGHMGNYCFMIEDFITYQEKSTSMQRLGEPIPYLEEDLAEFFNLSIEETQRKIAVAVPEMHIQWRKRRGSVEDFYRDNIYYVFSSACSNNLEYVQKSRFTNLMGISKQKILDFGCGIGISTCLVAGLGNEVIGYDINKKAIDFANFRAQKHNYKPEFTTELPELGQFDLVLAIDVLEHIEDLHGLILKLGKGMKHGARLYHYDTFQDGSPDHFDHHAHIEEWLTEAGFEIIDTLWARRK